MKKVYIGIAAHKDTNSLALAFSGREAPVFHVKVSTDLNRSVDAIRKIQKQYGLEKDGIALCYEAGPTGFVLDRRDARKLARLHRAGELTAVNIPDVEDEVIRDVCRGRTDAVNELVRAKKQLLSFLLRNG